MKTLNKWMMLCGVLVGVLGVGCGGPIEQEATPGDAQDGEVHATVCSEGYWQCPSDGEIFEYQSPLCGGAYVTKPRAQTLCEAHCPVTCTDSGWMTY